MRLLEAYLSLELVGSYGEQLPELAQIANPEGHIVVIDGRLVQATTLGWIRFWRGQLPEVHILVIELADDIDLILACIEAGAHCYTVQGTSSAEIAAAIHEMLQGRAHCSPEVAARVFARLVVQSKSTSAPSCLGIPLTNREMQVLHYLAHDYSNQEIAAELVIEVRTVKHHVHNILEKLQLRHRWDAARVAIERGWIKDTPHNDPPPT